MSVAVNDKKELFLEQFRVSEGLSGESIAAQIALQNLDFPSTRDEYWKYTRLTKIQNGEFAIEETSSDISAPAIDENASQLNCVNGFFGNLVGELPKGVEIVPIEEVKNSMVEYQHEFFAALNTAYFTSGVRIKIAEGSIIEKPIQLNFVNSASGLQAQPRVKIDVAQSASAQFIFNFQNNGNENNFWNVVSEMKVGKNAELNVHQLQQGGDENYLINTTAVQQKKDSRFAIHTICLEGKILRNNLNIAVQGQNCETKLNGVYLASGTEHFDNHTYVDHIAPNCSSSENYKGIIDDKATAVFNGKVMVQPDAQKINGFQSNQNILLSDDATVNSKPELEIYADDVLCSHGSTTGQLDEEAMFYLQTRGVSESSARKMLIRAFVFDVLDEIKLEAFRTHIEDLVDEKFKV